MWKCEKCGREFETNNQKHLCKMPESIDEYISMQPSEVQPILMEIRKTISEAAPNAVEKISYAMPTFWQRRNIIHFAAFKNHIGIYPGDEAIEAFKDRLTGYKTSKGTIQFPLSKPVDLNLISDITKWKVDKVGKKK